MKNVLNESNRGESCSTCRYYFDLECHFASPVTLDGKSALFPPVAAADWCGRWKAESGNAAGPMQTQQSAKPAGRPPRFDWDFFRGPLQTLCPTAEKGLGYNVLYRIFNDMAAVSKSSFNIIVRKGLERGELHRDPATGKYWVDALESKKLPGGWWKDGELEAPSK